MDPDYKCDTQEDFDRKLALVHEVLQADNADGLLDPYCPTSIVLWQSWCNKAFIVDIQRSHDPDTFRQHISMTLHAVLEQTAGVMPEIEYIY